jgi:hypothetical protein
MEMTIMKKDFAPVTPGFIGENGGGPGVRLRNRQRPKIPK